MADSEARSAASPSGRGAFGDMIRAGILSDEDLDPDGVTIEASLDALDALLAENERLRDALEHTGSLFSPLEHLLQARVNELEAEVAELRASGCARPLSAERDGAVNAKDNPPATGEGAL